MQQSVTNAQQGFQIRHAQHAIPMRLSKHIGLQAAPSMRVGGMPFQVLIANKAARNSRR